MSCLYDIKTAIEHFHQTKQILESDAPGYESHARAHWTSALVSYARAFTSGVRTFRTKALIEKLEEPHAELHSWLINMRDKHIAHSVNGYEDASAYVDRQHGYTSHGHFIYSFETPGSEEIQKFITLSALIANLFQTESERLNKLFQEEVNKLPDHEISKLPISTYQAPHSKNVGNKRRRGI